MKFFTLTAFIVIPLISNAQVKKYVSHEAMRYDWNNFNETGYNSGRAINNILFEFIFDLDSGTFTQSVQKKKNGHVEGSGTKTSSIISSVLVDANIYKLHTQKEDGDLEFYIITDKTIRLFTHYYVIVYKVTPLLH